MFFSSTWNATFTSAQSGFNGSVVLIGFVESYGFNNEFSNFFVLISTASLGFCVSFPSASYIFHSYSLFVSCFGRNTNPSGISSDTSIAYPNTVPSLYTLIVYVTISLFATYTGVLSCSYFIFPFSSTTGSGILVVTASLFTAVINFLNAKSKCLNISGS